MLRQASAQSFTFACTLCLLLCGCQQVPKQQGMLEREAAEAQLSSHQLRVMVNELVTHMADRIEIRADEILAHAQNPALQRKALLWKINGISSCFQAGTRPDPLASYLDVWILNRQMLNMFQNPPPTAHFDQWQPMLIAECQAFDRRLQHISQTLGGNLRLGETFVAQFAADFPLTTLYFDREPIASRYIEEVKAPDHEMFQVIANLGEDVDELKKLSVLFAEHLPKQARWEAQLLIIDTSQQELVQQPLQDLSVAATAASRLSQLADTFPALIGRERQAIERMVAAERQAILSDVERMRRETMAGLESERAVVLEDLSQERIATLDELSQEREALSQELRNIAQATLQTTDAITRQRTKELTQAAPHLIDHFFWRTLQLSLLAIAVTGLLFWLLRNRWRPTVNQAELHTAADAPVSGAVLPAREHHDQHAA